MKKKYYAVRVGRCTGIFDTWAECEKEVKGYAGAKFKSFTNKDDALAFINGEKIENTKKTEKNFVQNFKPKNNFNFDEDDSDFIIYTDGSCLKNPGGAGGWAAVITDKNTGEITELSGGENITTNNRMELSAALFALSSIEIGSKVTLITDSQYLKNAFTQNWLVNWQKRNWKTSQNTDVKNKDLWEKLWTEVQRHEIDFKWVKGHAGNYHNERCDFLAKSEAKKRE